MSGHTPGPWTFHEHGGTFYVWGPGQAMVADGETEEAYLARMRGVGRRATREEQEANARLIAAAPDLLQAVKVMVEGYIALVNSGDAGQWNPENETFVKVARAAISKAEGR